LSQCLAQWSAAFPVATLCANVLACAVLSFAVVHFTKGNISDEMRLFVTVGFCGGLSTFSTFSNETLQLLQTQRYGLAALYITCSVVVCLAGMVAVAKI
jgi:fluoride exporter